jgi:leader peptidase (prepilin peptidase)/N-methyltransferase
VTAVAAGLLLGIALGPALEALARAAPRRRGLEPRPLPYRAPALVLGSGALGAAAGAATGLEPELPLVVGLCSTLLVLAAIDLEHRIVPNEIVLPATGVALVARLALEPSLEWPLAACAAGAFFLVAALVRPSDMGMGDVKLAALLGAALGREAYAAILLGLLVFVPVGLVLLARHGRGATAPLAPFLALGGIVVALYSS